MSNRSTAALLGVALVGVVAYGAIGEPSYRETPDPALTPGAIAATEFGEVCAGPHGVSGLTYSQAHRATTTEMKDAAFARYGLAVPRGGARAQWEVDHLVPLCLGGADTDANLWPQPGGGTTWTYHDKDRLETIACHRVCTGRMALPAAQALFLAPADWRQSYCRLFPDDRRC